MEQNFLNWIFGIANLVIGFILKVIWDSYKALKESDKELADKVNKIEVLVAGQYVKREDFDRVANTIFIKLDKISDKLDSKMDK